MVANFGILVLVWRSGVIVIHSFAFMESYLILHVIHIPLKVFSETRYEFFRYAAPWFQKW